MGIAELLAELARIYPSERLLVGTAEVTPYESDGLTAFRVRPAAVVLPESQKKKRGQNSFLLAQFVINRSDRSDTFFVLFRSQTLEVLRANAPVQRRAAQRTVRCNWLLAGWSGNRVIRRAPESARR
jgi:hypothetical protein